MSNKKAYRTTMPFTGGLSPTTPKSRQVPEYGGDYSSKKRQDFDRAMGGDHMFTEDNADGTKKDTDGKSMWMNEPFEGEIGSWIVVMENGHEREFRGMSYDKLILMLRENGISYKAIVNSDRKDRVHSDDTPHVASTMPWMKKKASKDVHFLTTVSNVLSACFKVESEDYSYMRPCNN
jgi:hypothetical protein